MEKLIIAIDGYSSCGKSSFAKAIARKLEYMYLDSGAMYRAFTLFCINRNIISGNAINKDEVLALIPKVNIQFKYNVKTGKSDTLLNGENVEKDIRTSKIAKYVSEISRIKEVREKMVLLQREMGSKKGIVMDGRDIGTVVFPNAEIKIFMTASVDVRAERRYKENVVKNIESDFHEIKANLQSRDYLDETREESPLKKAADALILDNSNMTPDEQMEWFMQIIEERL